MTQPPTEASPAYQAGAPAPPPLSPGGQPLANFGDRLLARLIDGLILGTITAVVSIPAYLVVFLSVFVNLKVDENGDVLEPTFGDIVVPWLLLFAGVFAFALLLGYLYEVELLLRRGGQSIGKQAARIRVVPVDPSQTLDRPALTRRWLVFGVAGTLVPAFSYIDGLWQLGDRPYQQCLHDKFARTVVVKEQP